MSHRLLFLLPSLVLLKRVLQSHFSGFQSEYSWKPSKMFAYRANSTQPILSPNNPFAMSELNNKFNFMHESFCFFGKVLSMAHIFNLASHMRRRNGTNIPCLLLEMMWWRARQTPQTTQTFSSFIFIRPNWKKVKTKRRKISETSSAHKMRLFFLCVATLIKFCSIWNPQERRVLWKCRIFFLRFQAWIWREDEGKFKSLSMSLSHCVARAHAANRQSCCWPSQNHGIAPLNEY